MTAHRLIQRQLVRAAGRGRTAAAAALRSGDRLVETLASGTEFSYLQLVEMLFYAQMRTRRSRGSRGSTTNMLAC